jgi:hypothetical protein
MTRARSHHIRVVAVTSALLLAYGTASATTPSSLDGTSIAEIAEPCDNPPVDRYSAGYCDALLMSLAAGASDQGAACVPWSATLGDIRRAVDAWVLDHAAHTADNPTFLVGAERALAAAYPCN